MGGSEPLHLLHGENSKLQHFERVKYGKSRMKGQRPVRKHRPFSLGLGPAARAPSALQKRDAASLTSAADHAVENRWSTAAASADFPCARNAAARPNSDHPFSGNRFRSSR